jgi:hypothetical protein
LVGPPLGLNRDRRPPGNQSNIQTLRPFDKKAVAGFINQLPGIDPNVAPHDICQFG